MSDNFEKLELNTVNVLRLLQQCKKMMHQKELLVVIFMIVL